MERKNEERHNLKNFILLFTGQTVSQFGSAMTGFATIIWAYTVRGEVMASSLLAVCSAVPYLIVSLLGGAFVDRMSKKGVLLICDTVAAAGSAIILICFYRNSLSLWILCAVNIAGGFMNAFQGPASEVAVSLLVEKKDYARIGGIQSVVGSAGNIFTPVLATAALAFGGLGTVLCIDLLTFSGLRMDMKTGAAFIAGEKGILLLFAMYGVLEFVGAVSFDSMYSPLLLARTHNDEIAAGIVSSFIAGGCLTGSAMLSVLKQPQRKLPVMYAGSFVCLLGITLFGMGQNLVWWCAVAFLGCSGSPVYQTYQTVILRERVPLNMQGRVFAIRGMITQMLTPTGYLLGALLADRFLEPFMKREGNIQRLLSLVVGKGDGAGIGLIFVISGLTGIALLTAFSRNRTVRELDSLPVQRDK